MREEVSFTSLTYIRLHSELPTYIHREQAVVAWIYVKSFYHEYYAGFITDTTAGPTRKLSCFNLSNL